MGMESFNLCKKKPFFFHIRFCMSQVISSTNLFFFLSQEVYVWACKIISTFLFIYQWGYRYKIRCCWSFGEGKRWKWIYVIWGKYAEHFALHLANVTLYHYKLVIVLHVSYSNIHSILVFCSGAVCNTNGLILDLLNYQCLTLMTQNETSSRLDWHYFLIMCLINKCFCLFE